MNQKPVKNIGKSVLARLQNLAKNHQIDFNRMLLLFFQERFLYRLSISEYRDRLILKGGVLFYGAYLHEARPTKDIDFLGKHLSQNPQKILSMIQSIASIKVNDGVVFDSKKISLLPITKSAKYEGIRIQLPAQIDSAIHNLQIDIGFGDWIRPVPKQFEFPRLLEPNSFAMNAYSWESVIAEKFEAIVKFHILNSRLKDFYDIYFLQANQHFNGLELKEAVSKTFQHRLTDMNLAQNIFSETFIDDKSKQKQWNAFLRKFNLNFEKPFNEMMLNLQNFLGPVIDTILTDSDFLYTWDYKQLKWKHQPPNCQ